jgi:hypothetical protein
MNDRLSARSRQATGEMFGCLNPKGIRRAKAILFQIVEPRTLGMGRGPFGAALEHLTAEAHSAE